MSAFAKIKAIQHTLSASEAKLASFTLASPSALRDMSSSQLAQTVHVSQSSVIKFAQKLGYKGYPAFKLSVIDALNKKTHQSDRLHGEITLEDDFNDMADKLLTGKINVLSETRNLNEKAAFTQAIQRLISANRILISGVGGSALVCKDLCYKLQKLGMQAQADADSHIQLAIAATLKANDVVIAISESGTTREVTRVIKEAQHHQCQVISITRYGKTPINQLADVKLYSVAESESTRLSSIHARTAQNLIIDLLFIALIQASEPGRSTLAQTNKAFHRLRNS
ncbi:HTH-type transcriptional regulator MurR [Pseudidiomarina piscicola]|uniref:HTH-type transcriptional regulator MurR n=1 Tax=Pseudidiomarina piscicola TaxID=2614830 RepID=A0A6S6WLA8_9GAMM|nr:MurR/RpiR family transcriptional regulator [Pseudidiomarina piscicola]CAB0150726.1 HTH-type transcriptional regulator MurR [Pseudidiomarina piscicola]VZT40232.1 HTH-type transcriptional regulator MurR [Pseudomonas aeruginosa]